MRDLLVDVTIRHPIADRYQPMSAHRPGATAAAAEQEKRERYPTAGGRSVTPFALETWGRLGDDGENLLQFLAGAAAQHARWHGRAATASSFMRRWRASIDGALQRSLAAILAAGRNGLPGRPVRRIRCATARCDM